MVIFLSHFYLEFRQGGGGGGGGIFFNQFKKLIGQVVETRNLSPFNVNFVLRGWHLMQH